jgi:hypothetical protein
MQRETTALAMIEDAARRGHVDISDIDPRQLIMGYQVELEHGTVNPETNVTNNDPVETLKIAVAHIRELPDYYTRLKKMEGGKRKRGYRGDTYELSEETDVRPAIGIIFDFFKRFLYLNLHQNTAGIQELEASVDRGALSKFGVTPMEEWIFLGGNSNGIAFNVGNNIVVKLTSAADEAAASADMMGVDSAYVCPIYGVFQSRTNDSYVIVQKLLAPFKNPEVQHMWGVLSNGRPDFGSHDLSDVDEVALDWSDSIYDDEGPETAEAAEPYIRFAANALAELQANGLEWHDFHPGNVMYDPSAGEETNPASWRVIDLGYAYGAKGDSMDILQELDGQEEKFQAKHGIMFEAFEPGKIFNNLKKRIVGPGKEQVAVESGPFWAWANQVKGAQEWAEEAHALAFVAQSATDGDLVRVVGVPVEEWKKLGSGSNGTAFSLGDGRVLKVTKDASEATASAVLKNNPSPYVSRIYRVFQFKNPGGGDGFVVIAKQVKRLSDAARTVINDFYDALVHSGHGEDIAAHAWAGDKLTCATQWVRALNKVKGPKLKSADLPMYKRVVIWLASALEDIALHGVHWIDCHGGNIMHDPEKGDASDMSAWRVIDLGMSRSMMKADMDTLIREQDQTNQAVSQFLENLLSQTGHRSALRSGVYRMANSIQVGDLSGKGIELKNLKMLGEGGNGTAFDAGNGTVLKVTFDEEEAASSASLIGKDLNFVNKILGVWKVSPQNRNEYENFIIWQKKLNPVSRQDEDMLTRIRLARPYGITQWFTGGNYSDEKVRQKEWLDAFAEKYPGSDMNRIAQMINWVFAAHKELGQLGIYYADFKGDNVMSDPEKGATGDINSWKIIDLGLSESSNPGTPGELKEGYLFLYADDEWPFLQEKPKSMPEECTMEGPYYHGTSAEIAKKIKDGGFKVMVNRPSAERSSNPMGEKEGDKGWGGNPLHPFGFGVYLCLEKRDAMKYADGEEGLITCYLRTDEPNLSFHDCKCSSKDEWIAFWKKNGYDPAGQSDDARFQATKELTSKLSKKFGGVRWIKPKGRGYLHDVSQLCIYDPEIVFVMPTTAK